MILISVDFPVPFSPISACTSPARNSNEAFLSACTPAYDFSTSMARSRAWFEIFCVVQLDRLRCIVNYDHVQLARSMNADGQGQLDIRRARGAGDEGHGPTQPAVIVRKQFH